MYRRLILFLHFTFCILHSASAGIVSDDSKMFFSGGDWLPDAVPNSAIYDSTDISSKELRITTNVTAALYSTVSAFLERFAVGGRWTFEHLSDFKTGILSYAWWGYPSNRVIRTARLLEGPHGTGESYLGTCRDYLQSLANSTDEPGSYARSWGSSKLDEQLGAAAEFPEFGWFGDTFEDNTNAFRQVFADDVYPSIWPEYQSCSNDSVWKVEGSPVWHVGLCNALELFQYGDFYPAKTFDADLPDTSYVTESAVYTNPSPSSCYRILTDRFGDHASAFTNTTRRLSYYRIGTIEAGIASIDTEYYVYAIGDAAFKLHRLTYAHSRSGIARATVTNAQVRADGTVEFSMPPLTWQDTESWTMTTNEEPYLVGYDSSYQPNYALLSDSSSVAGHIAASASISLSYYEFSQMLSHAVDHCGTNELLAAAYVYNVSPPTLTTIFQTISPSQPSHYYSESQAITPTEISLTCTVAASRGAVVRITGDFDEREADTCPYWNESDERYFDMYLPEIQLIACETRYGARADSPYIGDEPDWEKDPYYIQYWPGNTYGAYTQQLDFRATNVGTFTSPNSCLSAWRRERLRFRSDISGYAASFGGVNMESRESIAGFPASVLSSLKGQMPTSCRGMLGYGDNPGRHFTATKTDDAIIIDGSPFIPGDLLHIVDLPVAIDDPHLSASMPSNTLFTVTGTCQSATRVKWRFKNLHEE